MAGASAGSAGSADAVGQLYQHFYTLESKAAAADDAKHDASFQAILSAGRAADANLKTLAAQFIPKVFSRFPRASDAALAVMLLLAKDPEMAIRVHAVRGFAPMAKEMPQHLPKITEFVATQLLAGNVLEVDNTKRLLGVLVHQDAKVVFAGLINQVVNGDDPLREKIILFVRETVLFHAEKLLHPRPELERFLADEIKKVLGDVTGDEFRIFMEILRHLKIFQTGDVHGAQELLDIVADQADLAAPFQPTDADSIDRLAACLTMAQPLLLKNASNSRFLEYLANSVLPRFGELSSEHQFTLLKLLAETCMGPTAPTDAARVLSPLFAVLLHYLPGCEDATDAEHGDSACGDAASSLNFTFLETLLYIFHLLASKAPNTLPDLCGLQCGSEAQGASEAVATRKKTFLARLGSLDTKTAAYLETLCQVKQVLAQEDRDAQAKLLKAAADKQEATDAAPLTQEALATKQEMVERGIRACRNIRVLVSNLLKKGTVSLFNRTTIGGGAGSAAVMLSWRARAGPSAKRGPTEAFSPSAAARRTGHHAHGGAAPMVVDGARDGGGRRDGPRGSGRDGDAASQRGGPAKRPRLGTYYVPPHRASTTTAAPPRR